MASSVSSERVFSSAGITISKLRNCLDANIIEALQCLKSLIHQDLMLRDVPSIAEEEAKLKRADKQLANQDTTAIEVVDASDGNDLSWEGASNGNNNVIEVSGNDSEIDLTGSLE